MQVQAHRHIRPTYIPALARPMTPPPCIHLQPARQPTYPQIPQCRAYPFAAMFQPVEEERKNATNVNLPPPPRQLSFHCAEPHSYSPQQSPRPLTSFCQTRIDHDMRIHEAPQTHHTKQALFFFLFLSTSPPILKYLHTRTHTEFLSLFH